MFKLPQRWCCPLLQQQISDTPARLLQLHTRLHHHLLHAYCLCYTEILYLQSSQSYREIHKSRSNASLSPSPYSFIVAHEETLFSAAEKVQLKTVI